MDINKVAFIELDETVYLKPTITIYDKDKRVLNKMTPKPDKAWELYISILTQLCVLESL